MKLKQNRFKPVSKVKCFENVSVSFLRANIEFKEGAAFTVRDFNGVKSSFQPQFMLRVLNEVVTTRRLSATTYLTNLKDIHSLYMCYTVSLCPYDIFG